MKVFGIGFHKTGLTSLFVALELLGYRVKKGKQAYKGNLNIDEDISLLSNENYDKLINAAGSFDALLDNPWNLFYKHIDREFENSRFILTHREEEEWIKSAVNYFDSKSISPIIKWIYKIDRIEGNEQVLLDRYRLHNENILDYFKDRPNDLLIVDWTKGDGWKELCDFLNKPQVNLPFPHFNKLEY